MSSGVLISLSYLFFLKMKGKGLEDWEGESLLEFVTKHNAVTLRYYVLLGRQPLDADQIDRTYSIS